MFFGANISFSHALSSHSTSGMRAGSFPFTYLGVPIFLGAPKTSWLKPIADRVVAKMEAWKGHSLSMSSHLALIKSTIYGSLLHSFMIYKWPYALLKYIEMTIRNFFMNIFYLL